MYSSNEVSEIIKKYDNEEMLLIQLINRESTNVENNIENSFQSITAVNILDDAIKRNTELIKELELVKAKLRSKAIFSPAEIEWDSICRRYQENPSLLVTSWRCHLPIFI